VQAKNLGVEVGAATPLPQGLPGDADVVRDFSRGASAGEQSRGG
jgi:hypothetical protein